MAEAGRDKYLESQAPRKKRQHPARHSQALKTSGAGIVHRQMMDLQRQPNLGGADVDRLKGLRRDWNRNRKYTDAGMSIAGASTPQDAMKYYSDTTEDFRKSNKPAYGQMYPITAGIMNIGEKGGILGAILSEIGKMGKDGGLPTIVDDTEEEQIKYVTDTFGPHREDIEEIEEVTKEYEGPWPHDERSLMSDEQAAWLREMNQNPYYQNLQDPNVVLPFEKDRRGHPHLETYTPDAGPRLGTADPHEPEDITVAPWLTDPSIPMPEELVEGEYVPGQFYDELIEEEAPPPIAAFNDSNREAGIASLHGQGPQWADTNRRYEKEYWQHMMSGGEMMPYEVFERMYEKIYQGKPHALHSSYR